VSGSLINLRRLQLLTCTRLAQIDDHHVAEWVTVRPTRPHREIRNAVAGVAAPTGEREAQWRGMAARLVLPSASTKATSESVRARSAGGRPAAAPNASPGAQRPAHCGHELPWQRIFRRIY
jgi:hypothetical protein